MNVVTGRDGLTLVDIADRLLDTGVVLDGEATISVADVDLIWLGLNVALTSFDRVREKQASGTLAWNVPGKQGPGTMSASLYSEEVAELKAGVERLRAVPERVNVDPDDVEKGLAKLVLTIVEFIRQLLERQAVRRMERGTLTEEEVERVGLALERLDRKLTEMAARFGLARDELRLGLGPLGELV